ncbi:SusC/RagA family TonB-linked outer membrane protein [Algoriphagus algorifonticola]|uniref:SusC/RagA family TonB-linked outer membrane protein n=1 Tax=Algoriphagus algorifonticola TaxID=2593007 RepID=UPI0011A76DEC|nr:TonB-dependent receptor [Algoriphagus algorifonticola]
MKKVLLFVLMVFLGQTLVFAQGRTVSGTVMSSEDGLPVPGASVLVKGTTTGVATDLDGKYTISVPSTGTTLVFSFVGLMSKEVQIGNQSIINVTLDPDLKSLSEVIVVGYGEMTKREVTGAIASVRSEDIKNLPVAGLDQSIQGRAAGVLVNSSSGTPGGAISINVRGTASISASNEPLYVVDGMPIYSGNTSSLGRGGQTTNVLSQINPNDIESIEVLKDAASAAIYGSRGANGVVLITTKRGKAGKAQVDLSMYRGIQEPTNRVENVTGSQWRELMNESRTNDGRPALFTDEQVADAPNADWFGLIFQQGTIEDYNVSIRGGTENTKFFVSGGAFYNEGFLKSFDFKRYSTSLALDHKFSDKVDMKSSLRLVNTRQNLNNNDNNIFGVFSAATLGRPDFEPFLEDGSYNHAFSTLIGHPLALAQEVKNELNEYRLQPNIAVGYKFFKGLRFETSFRADVIYGREDRYNPNTVRSGFATNGSGTQANNLFTTYLNENILSYSQTFGDDHYFDAILGQSYQRYISETGFVTGINFPGPDFKYITSAAEVNSGSSFRTEYALLSYFGRANYRWKDKLLVSASLRTDGSSRFGAENRFGVFPAGSVGYILSEESFLKDSETISLLKGRVSYGVTGNQDGIGNFQALNLYSAGSNYLASPGFAPSQLPNARLSWEESSTLNFGLDLGFLRDRFQVSAEYFIQNTTNLLLNKPIPNTSGFTSITENIGSMRNNGFELSLSGNVINRGGFNWDSQFNISFIKNEVTAIVDEATPINSLQSRAAVGQPLGAFFMIKSNGVDPETGDLIFVDLNEDGAITPDDRQYLGKPNPDFFGGLNNTFTYKGFDLNVFFQFTYGFDIINRSAQFNQHLGFSAWGMSELALQRWQQPGDITNIPRATSLDPNRNNRVDSDRWLEDGSFIRLKNLSLGYNLPNSVLQRIGMRQVRIYGMAQNLITWTKYTGWDPELNSNPGANIARNYDFLTFPQAKTFTLGINVGF